MPRLCVAQVPPARDIGTGRRNRVYDSTPPGAYISRHTTRVDSMVTRPAREHIGAGRSTGAAEDGRIARDT